MDCVYWRISMNIVCIGTLNNRYTILHDLVGLGWIELACIGFECKIEPEHI
jgi:hypothetical protein